MKLKHVKLFEKCSTHIADDDGKPSADGCEGITGGRSYCGEPMSHYLRFIRYSAVGPS
jgi:hypothetical protein